MNTDDAAANFSSGEGDLPLYFSERLKHRRQELDLSREQLAQRASCSVFAIRKMESGKRWPSRQLAELLAKALEIPTENQSTFFYPRRPGGAECRMLVRHPSPSRFPANRRTQTNHRKPAEVSNPFHWAWGY